jgi:tetratricopeptide (TPR) repeat protein
MTRQRALVVITVVGAAAAAAVWIRATRTPPAATSSSAVPRAEYVGAAACRECHAAEYDAWETSHHSRAMQVAETGRVLGNFDDGRFTYGSIASAFFKRDGTLFVRTDAADGTLRDFAVKYTFGVTPLQQYLIEMPDGRLQALSIAWDTRAKTEGGQRWFHLYQGDGVDHSDELHWTGRQQNWNFMCADCHSTNVRKGYDAAGDRFKTTWSELNVACEACHGPGSSHVSGSRGARASAGQGLTVQLSERRGVRWDIDPSTHVPRRSVPRITATEINVCAQCHSRREQIAEAYTAGTPFENHYSPSLIAAGLYYPDGQQRDEVYTYGSFLQSRMAHTGVTCADCHDPHSGRPRAEGNTLCAQCHVPAKYDSRSHHFHPLKTPGAECVSCHMPSTTYMSVDARRDHSIRIPRPDRSVSMGVPNACNGCHTNRTAIWADEQLRARLGRMPAGFQTFAEAFHAADSGDAASADALRRVADDASHPPIVRASALTRLADFPGRIAVDAAARHVGDPDPSVRRAALSVLEVLPPGDRVAAAAGLLRDPVRSVRLQAAWLLAAESANLAGTAHEAAFTQAAEEFIASRRDRADRPEDRTTLGIFYAQLGRMPEALAEYRTAIRLAPRFPAAYINLSDLQREQGQEQNAERTLRDGLSMVPDDPMLHHALGLSLARTGRPLEAVAALKRASELAAEPRFSYAYAVALHSSGNVEDALRILERARKRHPGHRDVLFALATFHRDAGRTAKAMEYAEQLRRFHPDDGEAQALIASLRALLPPHRPQ